MSIIDQDYSFNFGPTAYDSVEYRNLKNNKITTTKYNPITFVPKSLIMQFKRVANIYFLVISVLSFFPFSPKKPISMVGTFAMVLIATMIKEAVEDLAKYSADKVSNNKEILVMENGAYVKKRWYELKVGQIIKLQKDEEMPADGCLLKCSNENGFCYIDTKNLDGETNLKDKMALEAYQKFTDGQFSQLQGVLTTEKPNENLHSLEGRLEADTSSRFELKNVILKGCTLKNTEYVYAIILYVGKDNKIMRNSKMARVKVSNVLNLMNKYLYSLFIFQIVMCTVLAVGGYLWKRSNEDSHSYIFNEKDESNFAVQIVINFLTFLVAFNHLIPISLYVTLELIKLVQGKLIFFDNDMYDVSTEMASLCRSTDLIEELGQVDFVFSDKTGTLTQNVMELKKCYVSGKIFGGNVSHDNKHKHSLAGDMSVVNAIKNADGRDNQYSSRLMQFYTLLAVCHDVFPDKKEGEVKYQGASPDDIALVEGAAQIGLEFNDINFSTMTINDSIHDEVSFYDRLLLIPFDSDRKRMSVVVKDMSTKKLFVFTKGADTTMIPLIVWKVNEKQEMETASALFSKEGLRVLLVGQREIENSFFDDWQKRYEKAQQDAADLNPLFAEIERELTFIGCSAIEDKLQEGVPDTINTLLECNIKVWVLTGDKQDTAQEIAKSCNLIRPDMFLVNLSSESEEVILGKLNKLTEEYRLDVEKFNIEDTLKYILKKEKKSMSLIIDGLTLTYVLNNDDLKNKFVKAALVSKSVVCCRVSPSQKAGIVAMVKNYGKFITLSIGDGANDVPMILEAHIGVGIQGKEGTQAVRSSDFCIGQFRFLRKLTLNYGRTGYTKISRFICYYFYKNIILVFTEIYFTVYSGYSGQIFFADYLSTMYNAIFTSWPCIFTFVFERDLPVETIVKFPILYGAGQNNFFFNIKVYWMYIITSIFHGTACFFIPAILFWYAANEDGKIYSHWLNSTVSFTMIVMVASLKLLIVSDFWNFINIGSTVISIGIYYLILYVLTIDPLSLMFQIELYGLFMEIVSSYKAALCIFVLPFIIIAPDMFMKQMYYVKFPNPVYYIKKIKNRHDYEEIMAERNNILAASKFLSLGEEVFEIKSLRLRENFEESSKESKGEESERSVDEDGTSNRGLKTKS